MRVILKQRAKKLLVSDQLGSRVLFTAAPAAPTHALPDPGGSPSQARGCLHHPAPSRHLRPGLRPPGSWLPGVPTETPRQSPGRARPRPRSGAGVRIAPSGPRGLRPAGCPRPRSSPAAAHPGRVSRGDTSGSAARRRATRVRTGRGRRRAHLRCRDRASVLWPAPTSAVAPVPAPPALALAGGPLTLPRGVPEVPGVSGSGAESRRRALQIQTITPIQIWR